MLMAPTMLVQTLGEVVVEVFLSELLHWKEVVLSRLVQLAVQSRISLSKSFGSNVAHN